MLKSRLCVASAVLSARGAFQILLPQPRRSSTGSASLCGAGMLLCRSTISQSFCHGLTVTYICFMDLHCVFSFSWKVAIYADMKSHYSPECILRAKMKIPNIDSDKQKSVDTPKQKLLLLTNSSFKTDSVYQLTNIWFQFFRVVPA